MKKLLLILSLLALPAIGYSAVILQYHHVSNKTPLNTSISPTQFKTHLQYFQEHNFHVVALSQLINAIKQQKQIADKTLVITFDDAYSDILTHAKPLLDSFNYPFTVFVNPNIIQRNAKGYLSWQQLQSMATDGVIIANHGLEHSSVARIDSLDKKDFNRYTHAIMQAESLIAKHTGQHWRYFSYPYGEYTPRIQQWIKKHNFVAFSQRSGAVGLTTDLSNIPRFPASQPYDQLQTLHDKLYSMPLNMRLSQKASEQEQEAKQNTVYVYQQKKQVNFTVQVKDFLPGQLRCYIAGLGRQEISWQNANSFSIEFSKALPVGRPRCNCTAPSISKPGRYYWYSQPWFILQPDGQWFPW